MAWYLREVALGGGSGRVSLSLTPRPSSSRQTSASLTTPDSSTGSLKEASLERSLLPRPGSAHA